MSGRSLGAAGLTALLIGLVCTPWGYAAIGAFSAFGWPAAAVFLCGFGFSTLWLGVEGFGTPPGRMVPRIAIGGLAIAILLVLLHAVSGFTLMGRAERIGFLCTVWLSCASVWLVIAALGGERGPERRMRAAIARREWIARIAALAGFALLAALAINGESAPPRFPG